MHFIRTKLCDTTKKKSHKNEDKKTVHEIDRTIALATLNQTKGQKNEEERKHKHFFFLLLSFYFSFQPNNNSNNQKKKKYQVGYKIYSLHKNGITMISMKR